MTTIPESESGNAKFNIFGIVLLLVKIFKHQ